MGTKNHERDGIPSFLQLLVLLGLMAAVIQWINIPTPKIKTAQPIDACIDGKLHKSDGVNWYPVYINGTKRVIPCGPYSDKVK